MERISRGFKENDDVREKDVKGFANLRKGLEEAARGKSSYNLRYFLNRIQEHSLVVLFKILRQANPIAILQIQDKKAGLLHSHFRLGLALS